MRRDAHAFLRRRSDMDTKERAPNSSLKRGEVHALGAAGDRRNGCGFENPADANGDAVGQRENPLPDLRLAKVRRKVERKNGRECFQQLCEAGIVLPSRQFEGGEAIASC